MSKGRYFCGGSALAVTLAMTLGLSPSFAAQPPVAQTPPASQPPEDDIQATEVEEIISTGTFIRGTAEDAALPVEVIGRADILAQGNPTVEELVRNLSEIGFVQSQSARGSNAGGIGVSSLNLRNMGSGRTLITLNGRRLADDPNTNTGTVGVTGGAQQNLNAIPTGALQQIEILKDTGAATFGSDAVAGVVNFITRRDLNGVEADVSYKWIDGSDGGDYDATIRWGRRNDLGNILLTFEYLHQSPIKAREVEGLRRSPYIGFGASIGETINNDVGSYQFVRAGQAGAITPTGVGDNLYTGAQAISASGLLRDDACLTVGGYRTFSVTPSPVCGHARVDEEDLEYEEDTFRVFGDINFDLTDKIRYHAEMLFNKTVTHIRGQDNGSGPAPCDPIPANAPSVASQTSLAAGASRDCTQLSASLTGDAYSVPGYNPAVFDYTTKFFSDLPGGGTARTLTNAQISSITGRDPVTGLFTPAAAAALAAGGRVDQGYVPVGFGRMVLPTSVWQPFVAHSLPGFPGGEVPYRNSNHLFRTTQQLKGDLGEVLGTVIDYDFSVTYSRNLTRLEGPGLMVDRLQRGLNGFASNLDDLGPDGLGCTALETTGSRTIAGVTVTGVPYTVGAGGGADYNSSVAGNQAAPNGFNPGTAAGNRCYFVNPFASAITKSLLNEKTPVGSATQVGFVGGPAVGGTAGDYQGYAPGYGLANPEGIIRWLYQQREERVSSDTVNLDMVFNGQIPRYELWGGPVSWALGGQMRYVNRNATQDSLSDRRVNPCSFLSGEYLGLQAFNNVVNSSSTCGTDTAGLFQTDIGTTSSPFRDTHTWAAFAEFNLPITDRWNTQIVVRNERTKLPFQPDYLAATVWSGSTKYQITDQISVHASVAEHFDSPGAASPGQDTASNTGQAAFYTGVDGDLVSPLSKNTSINNVNLAPETGTNWSLGLDFQSPDRRWNASLDFFSITITGRPTTVNGSTIARAIQGLRSTQQQIDPFGAINCAGPLGSGTIADLFDPALAPDNLFADRAFVEFIDSAGNRTQGCRNDAFLGGVDLAPEGAGGGIVDANPFNDAGDLGLQITTPNQVNAGAEHAQGIEGGLSYRVPEQIWGGNLSLDLDITLNLVKKREDVFIFGINVTEGNDDIGTLAATPFSVTNVWRGSIGANYVRGRHMFNVRGSYVGAFADNAGIALTGFNVPAPNTTNINPANNATCNALALPQAALPIPDGFASSTLGTLLVGEQAFNAACNLQTNRGLKVGNSFLVNSTWRWQLPQDIAWGLDDTTLVVTVDNVFDRKAPYWRATYHYIPFGSVTPYGRTVKVGVQKKF